VLLTSGQLRIVLVLGVVLGLLEELCKGLRIIFLEGELGGRWSRGGFSHKAGGGGDHRFKVRHFGIDSQLLGIVVGSVKGVGFGECVL